MKKKKPKKLPTGKFARARVAGVAAAKVGAGRIARAAKKTVGLGPKQGEGSEAEAATVFKALSQLRGPALKLAQILSMEMGWLPRAYQKQFQKSCYQVPTLNRAVVRRIMTAELGKPPENLFSSFESEAFAAASLGQVHHASLSSNNLAIKIQYPGVKEALENDLSMARRLLSSLTKTEYITRMMNELEARFIEEADYNHEYDQTLWFYNKIKMKGVRVPRPVKELSTTRILTMEFLPGQHIDEWLKTNPTQKERNHAAQTMWDLFCKSIFDWHRMHADPNPGNFLFGPGGTVGLIDFGCVKQHTPDIPKLLQQYINAEIRKDKKTIKKVYAGLGVGEEEFKKFDKKIFDKFGQWMAKPFLNKVFDFGKNPDHSHGMFMFSETVLKEDALSGLSTETLMFDRNLHGLFSLFTRLNAQVKMCNQWIS